MIRRSAPLRRSSKPIPRKAARWGRKAKTGKRVPFALVTYRKAAKDGHELWRKLVYAKEPSGICPLCLKRRHHDAMHIFPKGPYPSVRLDLDNGVPGCRTCHSRFDSDHEFKRAFAERYLGAAKYEQLRLRAQTRGKVDWGLAVLYLRTLSEKGKR